MGVNSLPKTVTRQRRDCDLNPGPSEMLSHVNFPTFAMADHRCGGLIAYAHNELSNR